MTCFAYVSGDRSTQRAGSSHGMPLPTCAGWNHGPMSLVPNIVSWLFTALKKLGKDVRFVRFPDENHELSRSGRPRHRLARFEFILEWFDAHLKPERRGDSAEPRAAARGDSTA